VESICWQSLSIHVCRFMYNAILTMVLLFYCSTKAGIACEYIFLPGDIP